MVLGYAKKSAEINFEKLKEMSTKTFEGQN